MILAFSDQEIKFYIYGEQNWKNRKLSFNPLSIGKFKISILANFNRDMYRSIKSHSHH